MKSLAIQSNKENVHTLENGFYHRVPQASEYGKSECSKIFYFFETLEDGPLFVMTTHFLYFGPISFFKPILNE